MTSYSTPDRLSSFPLWQKVKGRRIPLDFTLEITARCNNDCRHCYINLPAGDQAANNDELTLDEINSIAEQAIKLGALSCLISGGEPLLRKDFKEIFLALKKKGLLVSVFTNVCLVNEDHIELFKQFPPRDVEVTVYGVTESTYENVTRKPGSYKAFRHGLDLLLENGIKVRLKAMAFRSNVHELPAIAEFCRTHTKDYFRFDPLLHTRYDGNPERNREILGERLSPAEIVALEQADDERSRKLEKDCDQFIIPDFSHENCNHLFHCGAGNSSFNVSYNGIFRLCADLWHPDSIYDLRKGTLAEAWNVLVPRVQGMESNDAHWQTTCRSCNIVNLCFFCPAHAHLETGELDGETSYYCQVAHARAKALEDKVAGTLHDQ